MEQLTQFLKAIDFKVTEGSEFGWSCFGPNARFLDCWNEGVAHASCVFDTVNQTVYEVRIMFEDRDDPGYVWFNPDYEDAYLAEARERRCEEEYITTDGFTDILEKTRAILNGEAFDPRVTIEIDNLDDDVFMAIARKAHDRDITFNQMMEIVIRAAMDDIEAGKMKDDMIAAGVKLICEDDE